MEYYILIYVLVILITGFLIVKLKNVKSLYADNDVDVEELVIKAQQKPNENKTKASQIVFMLFMMFAVPIIFTIIYYKSVSSSYVFSAHEISFQPSIILGFGILFFICMPLDFLLMMIFYLVRDRFKPTSTIKPTYLVATFDLRNILILFFIMFTLGFPFLALNANHYSYYEDNTIYVNHFFNLEETEYTIPKDIDHAEFSYKKSDGEISFCYYIHFINGKKIEILSNNYSQKDDVIFINEKLKNNNIEIEVAPLTANQWKEVKKDKSDEFYDAYRKLYGFDD